MALFTRWFTKFRRTRPACSRASFTMAAKRAAPGEQAVSSPRQRISAGSWARMSSATLRHLTHTRPSGATKVKRPNGSWLFVVSLPYADASGVAVGSTEASWMLSCALSVCFAITSLMVKNCAGAGAGVLEIRGAMVPRRRDVVTGATTGADSGGVCVASEAMTIGCGARSGRRNAAGSARTAVRAAGSRKGGGIARSDVRDDRNLAGRGRIGVERRHGDEAEEQHNRQPLNGDTRPRLRTHVQHPASGALKRQLNVPLAPDLLTELAIRPALLRAG